MTEKEFIAGWAARLNTDQIKKFPDEFMSEGAFRQLELPGKTLVIGEEFFGAYEILTIDGNAVYQAANHDEAKYIIYSNRDKAPSVNIPEKGDNIKSANVKYEQYLDSIIRKIDTDYKKNFNGMPSASAVNEIFRTLNLVRY
jgi:hypothetical protein